MDQFTTLYSDLNTGIQRRLRTIKLLRIIPSVQKSTDTKQRCEMDNTADYASDNEEEMPVRGVQAVPGQPYEAAIVIQTKTCGKKMNKTELKLLVIYYFF